MATALFKKEELQELVWEDETDNLEVVSDEITSTSRWSVHRDLIFKEKSTGKFYETGYSRGATEQQDESPFEYEPDEVECVEVRPVEKTVTVYEAVNEAVTVYEAV